MKKAKILVATCAVIASVIYVIFGSGIFRFYITLDRKHLLFNNLSIEESAAETFRLLNATDEYQLAYNLSKCVRDKEPHNTEALIGMAYAYSAAGNYPKVVSYFDQLKAEISDMEDCILKSNAYFLIAKTRYAYSVTLENPSFTESFDAYGKCLGVWIDDDTQRLFRYNRVYLDLAEIYGVYFSDDAKALECLLNAYKAVPDDPTSTIQLAEAYSKRGEFDTADVYFDKYKTLEGYYYSAYYLYVGIHNIRRGLLDEGTRELDAGVSGSEDKAVLSLYYSGYGMFYEAKGEQDTARSYYSKALDINPLYAYSPDWNCNEVAGRLDMDITEYRVRARREVEEKYLIEFE